MAKQVLVLVPPLGGAPRAPESTPVGHAALVLASDGIEALFCTGEGTWRAHPGEWEQVTDAAPIAVHDRFPSQSRLAAYEAVLGPVAHLPMGNPRSLTRLCRDKVACQEYLVMEGLRMPPLETDPALFAEVLASWGAGFLKPRYGGLGLGVRRVVPGDDLPAFGEGAVPGEEDPLILQQAIAPPKGQAGFALRWLVQRLEDGTLQPRIPVARISKDDPVSNVARGASAHDAREILPRRTLATAERFAIDCAQILSECPHGEWLVEIGVDMVVDPEGIPHVIEINSRPQGRMQQLTQLSLEMQDAHIEACAQPIRTLAAMASGS
jgi:glutathione synthase/RimK-type ligase-like ATP-grasp enzyme